MTMRKMDPRQLPCALTDQEKLARGMDLAKLSETIQTMRDIEASRRKGAKVEIEGLELDQSKLAATIRQGTELRLVEVGEEHDLTSKVVRVVRLDTGAILTARPMTQDELQMVLFEEAESGPTS